MAWVFRVYPPPPKTSKNHVEKTLLREFCRYFRAEISHGDPDREQNHLQKSDPSITSIFSKSQPHISPQPNPQGRKWPQMDSLVMNFSSKSVIFVVFYNIFHTFHEKTLFHFQTLKNRFQRTLCSGSRHRVLFLSYDDKHFLKKLVSYLTPGQSTRTKMTANGFSSYEVFVKLGFFLIHFATKSYVFL